MKRTTIVTPARTPKWDHMRSEQLHSLVDGRAKWPDGSPREIGIPLFERMQKKKKAKMSDDAEFFLVGAGFTIYAGLAILFMGGGWIGLSIFAGAVVLAGGLA